MNNIPYGRQNISLSDIEAVIETLNSDFLTQGPMVNKFEEAVRSYVGAKYCIAVSNATAALHLACLAMDLEKDDELWTSPISFVASSNCALYCGAQVDFVDIDSNTYNMCPNKLEEKLKKNKKRPKIVVPVHLSGQSCDMEAFNYLATKYEFKILEDSSHAIGATYKDTKVGSCTYSDASVFSFHPVKIITTGEGGIVTTNDEKLYEKLQLLRSHGITRDKKKMSHDEGPWYYEQLDLGYNYRITDLQCALGYSQLQRLDSFINTRQKIAKRYNEKLKNLPIILPYQLAHQQSAFHLYLIKVKNRKTVFNFLREQQIGVNVHYIPIHLQPYYQTLGFKAGDFPIAESYYQQAISLPIYPDLSEEDFLRVLNCLTYALELNLVAVN